VCRTAGAVKEVINYYANKNSHVFACFIDLTKVFDRVNYWKLFNHLLDDGIDVRLVRLLAHWYASQQVSVLWNNIRSLPFTVNNGTKQGGVLSPYLFTIPCLKKQAKLFLL